MKGVKEIEGCGEYRGFTIHQNTKRIDKTNKIGNSWTEYELKSGVGISRCTLHANYVNKDITKRLVPLFGSFPSSESFTTVKKAKEHIDFIISQGMYWMKLSPKDIQYIKTYPWMYAIIEETAEREAWRD